MKSAFKSCWPLLMLAILLFPWAWELLSMALNTNHAWLLIAAQRLLGSGHMSTDFYDPDPPLSIALYIPDVLLAKFLPVPLYVTPYLSGLLYLALAALAINAILRRWPEGDLQTRAALIAAFVSASTLIAQLDFAERDEIVTWGLLPFLLAQLSLTRKIQVPARLLWPVLILGAVSILIKPQYGIFPVVLLAHRMIRQKRFFSICRDPDFLALGIMTLVYAASLLTLFSDYLPISLNTIHLYIASKNPAAPEQGILLIIIACIWIIFAALSGLPLGRRNSVIALLGGAVLALCLYIWQMKGFYYHLMPALIFFYCAAALQTFFFCQKYLPRAAMLAVAIMVVGGTFILNPPHKEHFLTHAEYKELPLPQLAASCGTNSSFFVFSENMEMIHQAALYTNVPHASRFPGMWWLPAILAQPEKRAKERAYYSRAVSEDFARWKPCRLAIARNIDIGEKRPFNFVEYFSQSPAFRQEMTHYRLTGQMKDNRRSYFRGTALDYDFPLIYDIYERQ